MERGESYISLKLDVPNAVELGDFVAAFTSLASEFDRFVRGADPNAAGKATLFVREVRQSSILAILIPWLPTLAVIADDMGRVLVVEQFVKLYGRRLGLFAHPKPDVPADTKLNELKDFSEQVAAIANNPGSTLEIAAIEVTDGEHITKAAFKFDTSQARTIRDQVGIARQRIEQRGGETSERVLMVFTRTDIGTPALGQNTVERVKIEFLSDKSLPLVYASDLAEERIKYEITEARDNVYKKGFMVDVIVETRNGKPVAYKVAHVHQVIDLED